MTQNPVYPDSFLYEISISGSWVDITSDVLVTEEVSYSYGIEGHSILDRVASAGNFEFYLKNINGQYSPYASTTREGWTKGIPLRYAVIYDGEPYYRFYGRISEIKPSAGEKGLPLVYVNVSDWMRFAGSQPVLNPQIAFDQTSASAIGLLLEDLPVQPLNTNFISSQTTFPTVFDLMQDRSAVQREIYKLSISDLGYTYLTHDKTNAETLIVEGYYHRPVDAKLKKFQKSPDDSNYLIGMDGSYLIGMDGSYLVDIDFHEAIFDNSMTDLAVDYGSNVVNNVTVRIYPRKYDTSPQVLWQSNPIQITPYETITVSGTFRDPDNLASSVCAMDIVPPERDIDYIFTENSNMTGKIWSHHGLYSASATSTGLTFTCQETNGHSGYLHLQIRGYGIYTYDELDFSAEDIDSQIEYGYKDMIIDQQYTSSTLNALPLAEKTLADNKEPNQTIESVEFLANINDFYMRAYLELNTGDLIEVIEDKTGTDAYFFIDKISCKIMGKIIKYKFALRKAELLNQVIWQLGVHGRSELGTTTKAGI